MFHVTHKQISEAYSAVSAFIKKARRDGMPESKLQHVEWALGKLEMAKRLSLPREQEAADQLFAEALGGGIIKSS